MKRSFVRPRMVILTVFKGNFYSIAVSCVSVLQYRTYARNRIGILKTSHLVKCPHGRCINKSFQSQMMQMRLMRNSVRTEIYLRTVENISESKMSKEVNIKPV